MFYPKKINGAIFKVIDVMVSTYILTYKIIARTT